MSSVTTSPTSPTISKLESSPTRRKFMTPTPFALAARYSPNTEESNSIIYERVTERATIRSPTKSTTSKSSTSQSPIKRQKSYENMVENVIYSSSSYSINREQINGNLHNGEINSETSSTVEERQCNKYGFFIGSQEADRIVEQENSDIQLIRKREKKWLHMLQHWDKFITRRWKKVRDRCRKGIPHSIRGQAWLHLCGAHHQMKLHPRAFDGLSQHSGNEHINDEIRKDLHRQFPSHEMFAKRNGSGQKDLFLVLKAFSILKPDIGYCQGQAPIASVLLMHMPAEHAFWSLVAICDHYLPGYFSPGLEAIQLHGDMLNALLKKYAPHSYKLLKKQKIDPILYMTEWFMCIFARTLPWTSVLRVWDMFLCEGIKIVFKVAITILSTTLQDVEKKCPTMYETLELLRHIPAKQLSETLVVERVLRLELHDRDLQREHNVQEKNRRKAKLNSRDNNKKS